MNDDGLRLADDLDREIADFLRAEAAERGAENLYQWYRNCYLPFGYGLAPHDRAIAGFALANRHVFDRYVEIGAAFAQTSLLCAINGMPAYAIESYGDHHEAFPRLLARVGRIDPTIGDRLSYIEDWYPRKAPSYLTPRTLLSFPSLSATQTPQQEIEAMEATRMAAGIIVNPQHFFQARMTQPEKDALLVQLQSFGFDPPVLIHACGPTEHHFEGLRFFYLARTGGAATKIIHTAR